MPSSTTPRPYPNTIDDRLKAAGPHLGYEWAMLVGSRHADWHHQQATKPLVALAGQHASTEVVLLHARLLFESLTEDRGRFLDNVRAIDLLEAGQGGAQGPQDTWRTDRGTVCPYLRGELDRLNQRLSHLSYAREVQPVGWDKPKIIAELEDAFRRWANLLTAQRRNDLRAAMEAVGVGACPF